MKIAIFLFSASIILASCATSDGVSEKVSKKSKTDLGANYGPVKVDPKAAISASEMMKAHAGVEEAKEYTFEGTINEVCAKAGCWVNIETEDGQSFMVRFKDHFTIPTDTKSGTKAFFHGEAMNEAIPLDMLRHYAEDAGKSPEEIALITESKMELNFIADGIVLEK